MLEPTYNPTPRELLNDVCAAYEFASRLTTTRICAPETYEQRSWFIWKTLSNVINYLNTEHAEERSGHGSDR